MDEKWRPAMIKEHADASDALKEDISIRRK